MFEKTIETENLVIKDSNGKKRIELNVDEHDDPLIKIYPKEGIPLMWIGMDENTPSIKFYTQNSLYQNVFSIRQLGDHFSLELGRGDSSLIKIGFNQDGDTIFIFFDDTQKVKLGLINENRTDGRAGLVIFDNDGNQKHFP
jgi:hypothetical protein